MKTVKSKSLLRKFSIIFVGVSLVPFIILFYLHSLYDESHSVIKILDTHFSIIMLVIGVICITGFFGMRMTVKKIILLTETVKRSVTGKIDEETMFKLAEEEGEIGELAGLFIYASKYADTKAQQPEPEEMKEIVNNILKKASEVVAVTNNHDNLLTLIMETATEALGAKQGALFSADNGRYKLEAWTGDDEIRPEQIMDAAQVYLDRVSNENEFLLIPTKEKSEQSDKLFIPPLIFSPLVHNEVFCGVLFLGGNGYWNNFTNEQMLTVLNLSHQLAVSLDNAKVDKNADQTSFETLGSLALAVEARDPYSRGHAIRVGSYAQKIGEFMRLSAGEVKVLREASLLHDIGKIVISYDVLLKQGKLTAEDKFMIRNHPVVGEIIVSNVKEYNYLLDPIRHHHEQLDGSGYPDGLKSGEISRVTSILTVADIFDALMEVRSYRSGMDFISARRELSYFEKTKRIDKDVLSALYHLLDKENLGKI